MLLGPYRPAARPIWTCDLTSLDAINRAGGVLTGAPTVDRNGLHLDGATQYGTFPLTQEFGRAELTLVAEVTIPLATLVGPTTLVLAYGASGKFFIDKLTTGTFRIFAGGVQIVAPAIADYSPYYKDGQRNSFAVTFKSGATAVYLNGTLIKSSAAIFTPISESSVRIGNKPTTSYFWPGTIHSLSFYEGAWTPDEAARSYRHSLWNYRSRASLYLDMKDATENTEKDGGERLVDGNMEAAGTGAWSTYIGAGVLTKDTTNPHSGTQCLRITNGVALENGARQSAALVPGFLYRWRGWARGNGNAYPRASTGSPVWSGTTSTDWQYFDIPRIAASASAILFSEGGGIGDYVEFDDVSVVPTGQLLDDGACEMAGTAEWTATRATISKPSSGIFRITSDGTGVSPRAYQTPLTVGRRYRATGEMRSDGEVGNFPKVGDGNNLGRVVGTEAVVWQQFDLTWIAENIQCTFAGSNNALGQYVEFRNLDVRPVYQVTTDKSRYGRISLLSDGYTAAGIPAFQNPGFTFDGATKFITLPASACPTTSALSISIGVVGNWFSGSGAQRTLWDTDTAAGVQMSATVTAANALAFSIGGSVKLSLAVSAWGPLWRPYGLNIITLSAAQNYVACYINGKLAGSNAVAFTPGVPSAFYIGRTAAGVKDLLGEVHHFSTHEFALSPIQVRELHSALQEGRP